MVLPGLGQVDDAQLFPGAPLLLLTDADRRSDVRASSVVNGAVTSSAAFTYTFPFTQGTGVPFRLLSFDDGVARAYIASSDEADKPIASIEALALAAPPGPSNVADALVQVPFAVPTVGAAVDTPQGTWIAMAGNTGSPTGVGDNVTSIAFAGVDGSVVGPQTCDPSLGATYDLVAVGDEAALGPSSPGNVMLALYKLSTDDGGSCTPLNALPTSSAYAPSTGALYPEDGGFTVVTAGNVAAPIGAPTEAVGIARVSADAAVDMVVGRGGYTFFPCPPRAAWGAPLSRGDTLLRSGDDGCAVHPRGPAPLHACAGDTVDGRSGEDRNARRRGLLGSGLSAAGERNARRLPLTLIASGQSAVHQLPTRLSPLCRSAPASPCCSHRHHAPPSPNDHEPLSSSARWRPPMTAAS